MMGEAIRQPLVKPEPRKRAKGRRDRAAAKVVKSVRRECVERDGWCRLHLDAFRSGVGFAGCEGASEWAHLGEQKRFKTRGMVPERRHTTAGSLMLCTKHHQEYDQGRLTIDGDDANKRLRFRKAI